MSPPTYIPLPPPPAFDEPFFTPPQSPLDSPSIYYTPPSSPRTDDPFPHHDTPIDIAPDDDSLTVLEKIYLYSRSKAAFHRVFISHALAAYLDAVSPQEATEYVLPLLAGLAMDEEESVKEALAAELVPIIWWFFTHCQIVPDDPTPDQAFASSSTTVTISVQAFTPILGTLLLSSNPLVGGAARFAVVDLLARMRRADDKEAGTFRRPALEHPGHIVHPWELAQSDDDDDDQDAIFIGLFGNHERQLFTQELLQQVVIGMARLDDDPPSDVPQSPRQSSSIHSPLHHDHRDSSPRSNNDNPYFPPLASPSTAPWPAPPASPSPRSSPTGNQFSPGTEFPPMDPNAIARARSPSRLSSESSVWNHSSPAMEPDWDEMGQDQIDEQAAVGRLSSMSLMAAVTAGGTLDEVTQRSFVKEVERVGRDIVYWVRREASFALGALAKVVPGDFVVASLLPLFNSLRCDPVWHVRHSALFALPAILSRLPPDQRRTVALDTLLPLSSDAHPTVRSGVLEALGEVIHSFHDQPEYLPDQLVLLFLGRPEDAWVRAGTSDPRTRLKSLSPLESFYTDPKRPLICAFNFPAVTLTLGPEGWPRLRQTYLDMTENATGGVQRTLASSIGEIAKIIGKKQSLEDLVGVWRIVIRSEDDEVRLKAIESLNDLFGVVGTPAMEGVLSRLLDVWNDGSLRTWRERSMIQKSLGAWPYLDQLVDPTIATRLLFKGLEDSVATVREDALSSMLRFLNVFSSKPEVIKSLSTYLLGLATSSTYRRRMTFIACMQPLVSESFILNADLLQAITALAGDSIDGVRIGLARFLGRAMADARRNSTTFPAALVPVIDRLCQDESPEVRSFVQSSEGAAEGSRRSRKKQTLADTFSRPPRTGRSSQAIMPTVCNDTTMSDDEETEYFPALPKQWASPVLSDEMFCYPAHAGPLSTSVDVSS